jgi:uncharacterized protein YjbI with pentapeptide repeats
LNPLVRSIVYDRLPNNDDKGWWRRWLLSYRVLIVEDTDLGVDADERVVLRERNFRFALLSRSDLHRADLTWADLRATQMWKTFARGKLKDTQLQGADLSYANLQGADLRGAQLQGANLEGVQLQGADLASAEVWLVKFPRNLIDQSPAPMGLTDLEMSALTPDAQAQLKQELNANITDSVVLSSVTSRLDKILRNEPPRWDDESNWTDYVNKAKEPSADELARFHAELACADVEGYTANRMAERANQIESEDFRNAYAKLFVSALLSGNCRGGKALTSEMRSALENLAQRQNED